MVNNGDLDGEAVKPATGFNAKGLPLRPVRTFSRDYCKLTIAYVIAFSMFIGAD